METFNNDEIFVYQDTSNDTYNTEFVVMIDSEDYLEDCLKNSAEVFRIYETHPYPPDYNPDEVSDINLPDLEDTNEVIDC